MTAIIQKLNIITNNWLEEQKYIPVVYTGVITLIMAFVLNVMVLASVSMLGWMPEILAKLSLVASILISFVVIPSVLYRKYLHFDARIDVNPKTLAVFAVLFLALLSQAEITMVLHFLAIAIGEEFLFREFHLKYLEKEIGWIPAVLITSILFSFLLHLNESFASNLLVRLPLGLLFAGIRWKLGLGWAVASHWLYNLFVTII